VRIDQKMMLRTRHSCGDVREDEIVPTVVGHQTISGGEVDACKPFLLRYRILDVGVLLCRITHINSLLEMSCAHGHSLMQLVREGAPTEGRPYNFAATLVAAPLTRMISRTP